MTPENIDWNNLSFSLTKTDYMYIVRCKTGESWQKGQLVPFGNIELSPAACVLNYGQGVFEGLKAYRSEQGDKVILFRPQENAQRMAQGCRRLCMPEITVEVFMDGVSQVTRANCKYIPPYRPNASAQAALYLRPVLWGTGPVLGVSPAAEYTFVIYCSPVGAYFKGGLTPIKLIVAQKYHRSMPGGVGSIKAIGNYAPGMTVARKAKEMGFSEAIYLDVQENKYLEEVGAANFFCIKNDVLLTPELDGCILPGVTRKSIIQLAKEHFGMKVEERKLAIDELLNADEAFASGTAAVVSPIGGVSYLDKEYQLKDGNIGPITKKIYQALMNIQHGIGSDPYNWRFEIECQ